MLCQPLTDAATGDTVYLRKLVDFGFCPRQGDRIGVHGMTPKGHVDSVAICSTCGDIEVLLSTIEVKLCDFSRAIDKYLSQDWELTSEAGKEDEE